MKRSGATVTEVLAAMGIGAVFAALVAGAVESAQVAGDRAVCATNLRQWAAAALAHAQDHDGALPRRGQGVQPVSVIDRPEDWFNALPPYLGLPPYAELVARGQAPTAGANSPFVCPSARPDPGVRHFFTYGMNMYVSRWDLPRPLRVSSIPDPSRLALFADAPGGYASTIPSSRAYSVSPRHGGHANVAFADGHVRAFDGRALGCGVGEKSHPDLRWKTGLADDRWTPQ